MSAGQILARKYRLIEQLNRGGMGSVWRAEHLELGTPAAVKLIDPTLAETEEGQSRFRREARAVASLRSTNIIQILDYGVDEGTPYIAMELLRGQSLAQQIASVGALSPLETATILSQVGKAVAWAHSMGIVHRDLKPDNIFLADDAGETVVKLLDFGIAKTFDVPLVDVPTTMTGAMMGTPYYMSPEQASGKRSVDSRADIWAFAVIAFECLTGKRPFFSDTLGGLVLAICSEPLPVPSSIAVVPAGFDGWFLHATERDVEKRIPTIRQAATELRRICAAGLDDSTRERLTDLGITSESEVSTVYECSTSTVRNRNSLTRASTHGGSPPTQSRRARWLRVGLAIASVGCIAAFALAASSKRNRESPKTPQPLPSEVAFSNSTPLAEGLIMNVPAQPTASVASPPPPKVERPTAPPSTGPQPSPTTNLNHTPAESARKDANTVPAKPPERPDEPPTPTHSDSNRDLDDEVGF